MASLAVRGRSRRLLATLHRWSGLGLLAFLLIAGLTGTWLSFRDELDRWINPQLRIVQVGTARVPLADVYASVEARFPGTLVTTTVLQKHPDDALVVYLRSKGSTESTRRGNDLVFNQVFVDPFTGRILGQRSTTRVALSRESLDPLILRLHYSLLMERPGILLMGGVAVIWLLTNIIGLALSWPDGWRRFVSWIPILSIRTGGGPYKVNYDVHRAIGVALLPVLAVLAFTSVYLNLPEIFRPSVNAFSTLTERPTGQAYPLEAATIPPDRAVGQALALVPDGRINSIFRDYARGNYSVLLERPDDIADSGDNFVYVDLTSGRVVATRLASNATAGDRFIRWQFPLHTGQAFGVPGRVVIAISGVVLVILNLTGFYVWWHKWRQSRARAGAVRRPASAAAPIAPVSVSDAFARRQTPHQSGVSAAPALLSEDV